MEWAQVGFLQDGSNYTLLQLGGHYAFPEGLVDKLRDRRCQDVGTFLQQFGGDDIIGRCAISQSADDIVGGIDGNGFESELW